VKTIIHERYIFSIFFKSLWWGHFCFKPATVFCLWYRFSKHKMTSNARNLWGNTPLTPWLRLWPSLLVFLFIHFNFTLGIVCFHCSCFSLLDWFPLWWLVSWVQMCAQGRNEGGQRRNNYPGAESLWGRGITAGAPNHCGGLWKVPATSHVLSSIQYNFFWETSGSNMRAPNLLSPRTPSNLVTSLYV